MLTSLNLAGNADMINMLILKKHLAGEYDWKHESEWPEYNGEASRRLFNRWDGVQVLFIINIFLQQIIEPSVDKGLNAEKLLMENLPFGVRSEISVLNWLINQN